MSILIAVYVVAAIVVFVGSIWVNRDVFRGSEDDRVGAGLIVRVLS